MKTIINNNTNVLNTECSNKENKRIAYMDIIRTFAILCVVLCHSVEYAYIDTDYNYLSIISQIFRIIVFTIGRLGVPIFLFLSGALILNKEINTNEDVIKFYKKNLLSLLISIEIWNFIYNIFLNIVYKKFPIDILIKDILFFLKVDMINMWYMPMILGIYIALPFLAKILKIFNIKVIKIPILITLTFSILLPSLNIILNILGIDNYNSILYLNFLGGCYGLYVILGYYLNNGILKKYNNFILSLGVLLMFFLTCLIQLISYTQYSNFRFNVWYDFITLFVCSVCIFELFRRINIKLENIFIKITRYISKRSLAIFFLHIIYLQSLSIYIPKFIKNNVFLIKE